MTLLRSTTMNSQMNSSPRSHHSSQSYRHYGSSHLPTPASIPKKYMWTNTQATIRTASNGDNQSTADSSKKPDQLGHHHLLLSDNVLIRRSEALEKQHNRSLSKKKSRMNSDDEDNDDDIIDSKKKGKQKFGQLDNIFKTMILRMMTEDGFQPASP